jgi:uncharacterized membrane protein HdeD (DUF308 family)
MPAAHPVHVEEAVHPSHHEPIDVLGRRALLTAGVMAALCAAALAAGIAGFDPWAVVLGALFLCSAIAELIDSAYARETPRARRIGAIGALPALLGLFFIFSIGLSPAAIATAVGVYFVADAVSRAAVAFADRYWAWGWDEIYAVIALAMGVIVLAMGGDISGSVLWYLVAAELFFRGVTIAERDLGIRRELARHRG